MEPVNIQEAMEGERQRLTAKLEEIAVKRAQLDQDEQAVHIEMASINAYFDVKMHGVITRPSVKAKKTTGARGPRQTGLKPKLIELVNSKPAGISKQDILDAMGAKGNKSMENAISNALVQLKKDNKIASGDRGQYKPVPSESTPAPAAPRRVKKDEAPAPQA